MSDTIERLCAMSTKRRALLIAARLAVLTVLLTRSQNKDVSRLETDHRQLQMLAAEAQRLSNENWHITELKATAAQTEQLRIETQDLHKLRNEVHQLRKRQKELRQARVDSAQLQRLQATSATSSGRPSVTVPFATQGNLRIGDKPALKRSYRHFFMPCGKEILRG